MRFITRHEALTLVRQFTVVDIQDKWAYTHFILGDPSRTVIAHQPDCDEGPEMWEVDA